MQIEAEITPHKSFPQKVKELLVKNDIVIFTAAAYAFAILSAPLLIGSLAPAPFSPLTTIPNWASWFDIWITFPALSILCVIPFRGSSRITKVTIVSLVAIIPLYLIFASYYFAYALAPFGFAIFATPLTLLVPSLALILLLFTPAMNSIILSRGISLANQLNRISKRFDIYFAGIGIASLALAFLQTLIRTVYDGTQPLTAWVSDIGIGVQAGGSEILHGIDPYVASVPPWGANAPLSWGPISMLLVSPFSILGIGWGAHISAIVYACVAGMGIWKCMKLISSRFALRSAFLFLALPTTSWVVESGTTLHVIATVFIIWSLYFFLARKHFWAGILAGLGMMAMLIPAALIVPFLFFSKERKLRIRLAEGFLIPTVFMVAGIFLIFPLDYASSLLSNLSLISTPVLYSPNLLLSPTANSLVRLITIGSLAFWFIYRSWKIKDNEDLLTVLAIFFLLLPFATGTYLAFYYVWASTLAVMAVFTRTNATSFKDLVSKG